MTERRHRRHEPRGFTLIELMISLLIASLLTIMVLAIFARVSFAYREQQRIAGINQVLSAARNAFEFDAKQAGLLMAQGFTVANDWNSGNVVKRSPLRVVNNNLAPDEVGFYYVDLDKHALVVNNETDSVQVTLDADPGFVADELVVLSTPNAVTSVVDATDAKIVEYSACILQVESVTGTTVTFKVSGSYGRAGNDHCTQDPIGGSTTLSKLVAHYWRIDTSTVARAELGALQLDTTGALLGIDAANFTDQAYGVADMQVATYFYDGDGADSDDPDSDGNRDWQSSDGQETNTTEIASASAFLSPLMLSVSLLARTNENAEGISTSKTPGFIDTTNVDNNTIGDRVSEALPHATNASLQGRRIYRHITFKVDLRNTGVGR